MELIGLQSINIAGCYKANVNFKGCGNLRYIGPNNFIFNNPPNINEFKNAEIKNYGSLNLNGCNRLEHIGFMNFMSLCLEEINLNDLISLKYIGSYSFSYDYSKKIEINKCKNLEYIGKNSFSNHLLQEKIDLSNMTKLKKIDNFAFCNYSDGISSFIFYYNYPIINEINLSGCKNLEYIGISAFSNLYSRKVNLSNCKNLKQIDECAFYKSAVEEINFKGCNNLEIIGSIDDEINHYYREGAFGLDNLLDTIKMYNDANYSSINYNIKYDTLDFGDLPNLKYIGGFNGILNKKIDFSKNSKLEVIMGFSYYNNYNEEYKIKELNLNGLNNLKEIEGFENQDIERLDFSTNKNLKKINGFNYNKLTMLDLTKNVNLKYLEGFNSNNISYIDLNKNIKLEYLNGFDGNNLTELDLSSLKNLTSLGGFRSNKLTNVNFSNLTKLKEIEISAFANEKMNFKNENKINNLDLSGLISLEKIGQRAFSFNDIKEDIKIPNSLKNIEYDAFWVNGNPSILRTPSGNNPNNIKETSNFIVDPIKLKISYVDEEGNKLISDNTELINGTEKSFAVPKITGYISKSGDFLKFEERKITDEERQKGFIELKVVYQKENIELDNDINLSLSYKNDYFKIENNIRADVKLDIKEKSLIGAKLRFYVGNNCLESVKIPGNKIIKSYKNINGIVEIELNEVSAGTSVIIPIVFTLKNGYTPDNIYLKSSIDMVKDNKIIAKAEEQKIKATYDEPSLIKNNNSKYVPYEKIQEIYRSKEDKNYNILSGHISYDRDIETVEYELQLEDAIYIDDDGSEKIMKPKFVGEGWEDLGNGKYRITTKLKAIPEFLVNSKNLKVNQSINYKISAKANIKNKHDGEKDVFLSQNGIFNFEKSYEYIHQANHQNTIYKGGMELSYISFNNKNNNLRYYSSLSLDKDDQNIKNLKIVEDQLDKRLNFLNIEFIGINDGKNDITPNAVIKEYKFKKGSEVPSNNDILLSEEKIKLQKGNIYEFKNQEEMSYFTIEVEGEYEKLFMSYNTNVQIKDNVVLFENINPLEEQSETFIQRLNVYFENYNGSSLGNIYVYKKPIKADANINKSKRVYKDNVFAGEEGTYELNLDFYSNYNEKNELKNFKAVFELPEGIDIEDIEINEQFKNSDSAKYEIIERYNGKQNSAIVFTADNFKFFGGTIAKIKTKTSNMMDEKTYTAKWDVDFENKFIKKENMHSEESFTLVAIQEISIEKTQKVLKEGSVYTKRKIEINPNDIISYKISAINKTPDAKENISIIDIIPFNDDNIYTYNTLDINENETMLDIKENATRGTSINTKFSGNVLINGKNLEDSKYSIKYSVSDPKLKKIKWQENIPENISDVKAIKVYIKNGKFESGERLDITFNIKADIKDDLTIKDRLDLNGKNINNNALKKDTLTYNKYVSTDVINAKIMGPKGTISFVKKGYKKSFWESLFNNKEILNAKELKDVQFNLIDEKGNFVKKAISNKKGEVIFDNVEVGNYIIREISAPQGYSVSNEDIIIKKEDFKLENGEIKLNIKDVLNAYPLYGNLKIIKKDVKGNLLNGINFTIKGIDQHNKDININAKTNSKGEIYIQKLKDGNYSIEENIKYTKGETNYGLQDKKNIEIVVDKENIETNGTYGTSEIEFVNDKARVIFNVIGFNEEVSNKPGSKYKHISEISNFNKEKLDTHNLQFEEIIEKDGQKNYKNVNDSKRFNSTNDYGYIELKTDTKYRVSFKENDFNKKYQGKYNSYEFYLSPSGKLEEIDGKRFKENRINFPVKEKEIKAEVTVFTNVLLSKEIVNIYNIKRKLEPVKAAKYDLYKINGLKENKIDTKESDETGKLKFENLSEGTYIVKLSEAPLNYTIKEKEFKFTVRKFNNNDYINNEKYKNDLINNLITEKEISKNYFNDAKNGIYFEGPKSYIENNVAFGVDFEAKKLDINLTKGELILSNIPKEDSENKLKALEGTIAIEKGGFVDIIKPLNDVKFDFYENDKLVGEIRSDEKGYINLNKDLSDKNVYTIIEKQAAEGYLLDRTPIVIDFKNLKKLDNFTGIVDKFIENKPYEGSLTISKYDRKTKKVLKGIEFTLYKEENREFKEFKKDITNEIGLIEFKKLPIGKYEVKETNTIEGYALSNFKENFEITKENIKFNYVYYNEQETHDIYITLIDKEKYNKEKPNELQNPDSYIKDADFVLSNKGKYLKILEQDKDTNVITKYEWVDKKDRSIIKTNQKGEIIIEKLYRGDYILEEIKAAEGYKLPIIKSRDITVKDKNENILILNEKILKLPLTGKNILIKISLIGIVITFIGNILTRKRSIKTLKFTKQKIKTSK